MVQDEKKVMEELDSKIVSYRESLMGECDKDKEIECIREFISDNYNHEAGYNHCYINKYLSKKSKEVDINDLHQPYQ